MVLHHVGDESATLRSIRSLLEPGGLLAIAEFGDPMRLLPDDADVSPSGFWDRLDAAGTAWLESTRPGSPRAAASVDYPMTLAAAGFEVVVDQVTRMHLEPPLDPAARRVALGYLQMMRHLAGPQLETADREALDLLTAEDHPLGILQRGDAFLNASRHLYVARAIPATATDHGRAVREGIQRG